MSHIDKQATIDAIYEKANEELADANHHFLAGVHMATAVVMGMPDAQPEEIQETGISRYGVAAWLDNMGYTKLAYAVMDKDRFPSVQPERKRGKWYITDAYPHNVYCSECYTRFAQTHWAVWEDGSLPRNFCPNCGADMRGKQDDSISN